MRLIVKTVFIGWVSVHFSNKRLSMKHCISISIYLFLMFLHICNAHAKQYIPPVDYYNTTNINTINQSYDIVWGLVRQFVTSRISFENKSLGIIQITIKGGANYYTDSLVKCGSVTDPSFLDILQSFSRPYSNQQYTQSFEIFPETLSFEIKLDKIANKQTYVSINLIKPTGEWFFIKLSRIYKFSDKTIQQCISTGTFESSVFNQVKNDVVVIEQSNMINEEQKQAKAEEARKAKAEEEVKAKAEEAIQAKAEEAIQAKAEEAIQAKAEEAQRKEEELNRKKEILEENNKNVKWKKAGFSKTERKEWTERGFDLPEAKVFKLKCPKGLGSIQDLIINNPYDFEGKCYHFTGRSIQTLSRTKGLFEGVRLSLLDFAPSSSPNLIFTGYVKGIGVFKYTAVRGDLHIVPVFKVIHLPDSKGSEK